MAREPQTITKDDIGKLPPGIAATTAAPARASKFPDLYEQEKKLRAARAAITDVSYPMREARDRLAEKIAPTLIEIERMNAEIKKIERGDVGPDEPGRLAQIDNQLGALTKAMGGRAMSDS